MEILKLHELRYSQNGQRLDYNYSVTKNIEKYFDPENPFYVKYEQDVSTTPPSLAVIPLLANIMPIAWYAGFEVQVEAVDREFTDALERIKKVFEAREDSITLEGKLTAGQLVDNRAMGDKSCLLFSGGVDSYATYIRIHDKLPDLVTILGADIEIEDDKQWKDLVDFHENEELLKNNQKRYLTTNLRDFYTYHVDLLLPQPGWWGQVQHGLGLVGVIAPLSFIHGYNKIYLAGTYTDDVKIDWGSIPQIDNNIKWDSLQTIHDGEKLKRQDKVEIIAKFSKGNNINLKLRVCYSELREGFNCSNCEKCFRTMMGIILTNSDPNKFGFTATKTIYPKILDKLSKKGFHKGMRSQWIELIDKAAQNEDYFILENPEYERAYMEKIIARRSFLNSDQIPGKAENRKKLKFVLRNRYPKVYALYQKIKN